MPPQHAPPADLDLEDWSSGPSGGRRQKRSFTKRVCRLTTYATALALCLGGVTLTIMGAYFVAVFARELPHNFINPSNSSASGDEAVGLQLDAGNGTAGAAGASGPPPSNYDDMPPYVWVPILLGIFLIVAAVVGCAGAKYYSRLLLLVYVVFVAGMLCTQFAMGMVLLLSPSTLAAGLGLAQQQRSTLGGLLAESQQAIATAFLVLVAVEAYVICSALCLAREVTGDELLNKSWRKTNRFLALEAERAKTREKRMMEFEMQARNTALGTGSKPRRMW